MSFSSAIRFELDARDKPLVFWQLAKEKKNNRKFDYKSRNQRFPPRRMHFEEYCEECRFNTSYKHSHKHHPRTNFVKKNIRDMRSKYDDTYTDRSEKPFANNVINRCTPRRRNANAITLTDLQLNTLLDAVRNLSPSSQSTIRFKLDGKVNEIQVNSVSDKDSQEGEPSPNNKQNQATVSEKTYDLDPATMDKQIVPVLRPLELERPRGVDRSGMFDGGSLSPILDELESSSDEKRLSSTADQDESKSSAPHPTESAKVTTIPSATFSVSNWSDPSFSLDLPPLVPQQHLTLAEKKKPQWVRERAEFDSCYDPFGRRSRSKTRQSTSRAGSILTDYPVMEDEKKLLQKIQERSKWLAELEKQREEQRLQRFERLEADRKAVENSFIDKFSQDRKPVPLPSQINIQKDRSVVTTMPTRYPHRKLPR